MALNVLKTTGQKEPFDEQKVLTSIQRAHLPKSLHQLVLNHIKSKLYEGIPSTEIYNLILEFLGSSEHPFSRSKYSLKEAIMNLGPTGYPFEDFFASILQSFGYNTQVRQIIRGKCISHEIDIIAQKDNHKYMIEAKFHNNIGTVSEVHVALYTNARFLDIKDNNGFNEGWLVTNTKITAEANAYAQCSNLKIISWDKPEGTSLRDLIEQSRLHPITILNSISHAHKILLLEKHTVMCKDIYKNPSLLDILPLNTEEKNKALAEIEFIYQTENHNS